ncbi:MAG TPA: hypothetical protein VHB25_08060 [Gemmatimonadaceae bacterium]|nr:hypothetical protein [Gemmatimonadaceae bacterium]
MRDKTLRTKLGSIRTTCRGRGGSDLLARVGEVGLGKYEKAVRRPGGLTRDEVHALVTARNEELHIACILAEGLVLHAYEWRALVDTEFERARDAGEIWNPFFDTLCGSVGDGLLSDLTRRGISSEQVSKLVNRLELAGEWIASRPSRWVADELSSFHSVSIRHVILTKARQLTRDTVERLIGDDVSLVTSLTFNGWLSHDIAAWAVEFVQHHMPALAAKHFAAVVRFLDVFLGRVPCSHRGFALMAQAVDAAFANAPRLTEPSNPEWLAEIETRIIAIVQRPNLLPSPTRAEVAPWLSLTRDSLRYAGLELVRKIPRTPA